MTSCYLLVSGCCRFGCTTLRRGLTQALGRSAKRLVSIDGQRLVAEQFRGRPASLENPCHASLDLPVFQAAATVLDPRPSWPLTRRCQVDLLWFLIVGVVAGWLAGVLVKGGGFGVIGDLVVGIIGAFVGGFLFRTFGASAGGGVIGSIVVATIGAIVLLFIVRLIKRA